MKQLLLLAVLLAPQGRASSGIVAGRVTLSDGTAVADLRVAAMTADDAGATQSVALPVLTRTDRDGRYRLEGIPPGRYLVIAGPLDRPIYFPGVIDRSSATVLTMAGATLEKIDMVASVKVRGRVDPRDTSVTLEDPAGSDRLVSLVDMNGAFAFPKVRPGTYALYVNDSLHGSVRVGNADLELTERTIVPVDVKQIIDGKWESTALGVSGPDLIILDLQVIDSKLSGTITRSDPPGQAPVTVEGKVGNGTIALTALSPGTGARRITLTGKIGMGQMMFEREATGIQDGGAGTGFFGLLGPKSVVFKKLK